MNLGDRIYVAGHSGLVGSAIVRRLRSLGYRNVLVRARRYTDLCDPVATDALFEEVRPDYVFLAAALVGGIKANIDEPGRFIRENLLVQTNVIESARTYGVAKLVFLGSSCIYPRDCPQPIREEYLMTGILEPTNSAYAVAKIAGIEMLKAYRMQYGMASVCAMPTNLYGPGDNYDPESSHVFPALIRRLHEAKVAGDSEVVLWGTGRARREFLHVDDCAAACVLLMDHGMGMYNVGSGNDMFIVDLATTMAKIVGYEGRIRMSGTGPDGTPRKLLDCARLQALGWKPTVALEYGIASTYRAFLAEGT